MTDYTVLLPALNEEGGIASTLDRLNRLDPRPEVIVIDDGSTDRTAEIARQKNAKVISHPIPGGYGRSLKDALKHATYDVIAVTDADGTYPVERIPEMVSELEKGYDLVVGARQGRHYRGAFLKMPARIIFKWLVEFTTGTYIPDINSGLRVFRKSQIEPYLKDLCNGFSFTTTMTLIYLLTGKCVKYVTIDYHARLGKSKVRMIQDSLRTLQYIVEVIATYNPLKLFVLLSGILFLFFGASIVIFILKEDQFFLLTAILFLIGIFVVFGQGVQAFIKARESRTMKQE